MSNSEMSPKDWALTLFLTSLPIIGLILLFIWAFGSGNDPVKANFAKGALILAAIVIVIYIIIFVIFGASMMSSF